VSAANTICEPWLESQWPTFQVVEPQWYAIHTRSRHEKFVTKQLQQRGFETFLPTVDEVHRWTDRRKVVQLPLFPCYAFLRMRLWPEVWHEVMQTNGVLSFVGGRGKGVPIPVGQIENLRTLLTSNAYCTPYPFLRVGQRVRIRGGALDGIEGLLTGQNRDRMLVISVEPIQRSVAVCIDQYQVEAI